LARRSSLLTPNLGEAAWLLDRPVGSESEARAAARDLRALGIAAVLVKGGHLEGDATDVLLSPAGESILSSPRIAGPSPRGTGCALASAIAIRLARGEPVEHAVASAKTWLTRHIASARPVGEERHL
jgi:hydroxymethylpyrimidine kinase/phosphomethylpyrimidine kinase